MLRQLINKAFIFQAVNDFLENPLEKSVMMRHDIDRLPQNALAIAKIENELGVKATYYFRISPHVFNESIIKQIIDLGHEIGYHYENLDHCKGNIDKAYDDFCINLEKFRKLYPVKTICMHGSPLSKWDNRAIWEKYDYKKLGIIGEPYFDIDYSEIFYLTDTGWKWNNSVSNIRDKVSSGFNIPVKSTSALIKFIEDDKLPNRIMINTHPHRWFNFGLGWCKELIGQKLKNIIKLILINYR